MADKVWILTLRPIGDCPPVPIRMRRLLKCLLRSYGFQCISVLERASALEDVHGQEHRDGDRPVE